jgi:chromate transporter
LAWGGPVAQIAMIRRELVDEEGWVTPEHFNRVFGLYQVLPGPEAHELCVYFGNAGRRPRRRPARWPGIQSSVRFLSVMVPWAPDACHVPLPTRWLGSRWRRDK